MTVQLATSEAREQFRELIDRVAYGKERIVLTRRGRPLAAIVPIDDLRVLDALENELDLEDARAGIAEAKAEGTVSWKDLRRRLELPPAECPTMSVSPG